MDTFAKIIGYIVILVLLGFGFGWSGYYILKSYDNYNTNLRIEQGVRLLNTKKEAKEKQDWYDSLGTCEVIKVWGWNASGKGNSYSSCEMKFRTEQGAVLDMWISTEFYDPYYLVKFKLQDRGNSSRPYIVPVEWLPPAVEKK